MAVVAFGGEAEEFVEVVAGSAEVAVTDGLEASNLQSRLGVVVLLLRLNAETTVFKNGLLLVLALVESAEALLLVQT